MSRWAASGFFVVATGLIERDGVAGGRGLHGFQHALNGASGSSGELGDGRGASEFRGQCVGVTVDSDGELLDVAGRPNRPPAIAHVALEFAQDGRKRERRERQSTLRIEAIDRVDESDGCDLLEILDAFDAAIAPSELERQGQELLDDRLPRGALCTSARCVPQPLSAMEDIKRARRLDGALVA